MASDPADIKSVSTRSAITSWNATTAGFVYQVLCNEPGYAGSYYYDPLSTASADELSVLLPADSPASGRWIRNSSNQNAGTYSQYSPDQGLIANSGKLILAGIDSLTDGNAIAASLQGAALTGGQQAIGNWTPITTGSLSITVNSVVQALSGLNFSTAAILTDVAATITAKLSAAVCNWNAASAKFTILDLLTGYFSTLTYATPTGSGTDISAQLKLTAAAGAVLTQGTVSTWRTRFAAAMRSAKQGYGGPGWSPFRLNGNYASLSRSYDVKDVNSVAGSIYDQYALGGLGFQVTGGRGTGPPLTLSTLVWAAGVVTGTTAAPHGLTIGQTYPVVIQGVTPSPYNGAFAALITGASTFTLPQPVNPGVETVPGTVTVSTFFSWMPDGDWDNSPFYYLQQPGGGTFDITQSDSNPLSINTAGTLSIQSVQLKNYEGVVSVSNILGNIFFPGMYPTLNNNFPVMGDVGLGGQTTQQWAARNSTIMSAWFALLQPNVFFLNCGMNDRVGRTAAQFQADLLTIISYVRAGAPNCNIILVQSNDPGDAATTHFLEYVPVKIAAAAEFNLGYLDWRDDCGNFQQAVNKGWMLLQADGTPDGIHPNQLGNNNFAVKMAKRVGLWAISNDPGVPAAGATKIIRGDLIPSASIVTIAAGVATTIYTLGLDRAAANCILELSIWGQLAASGAYTAKTEVFALANNSSNYGTVTDVSGALGEAFGATKYTVPDGGANSLTWTTTVTVSGGKALVKITSSNHDGMYQWEAKWRSTFDNQPGKGMYQF